MKPQPKPTPEQSRLYSAARSGTGNISVEAVAGSGKTTSAIGAAHAAQLPHSTGFVAFNSHIAKELSSRLGPSAKCRTLHSLGLSAVRRRFPSADLEEGKASRLLQQIAPSLGRESKNGAWYWRDDGKAVLKLTTLAKASLIDPDGPERDYEDVIPGADAAGCGYEDMAKAVFPGIWSQLRAIVDHHGIDCESLDDVVESASLLLMACQDCTQTYDFDDMIWLPTALNLPVDQFDLLFVDEAQDLNHAQHELAFSACKSGRMCVIGDTRQAIYGFAGSDPFSLPNLVKRLNVDRRGCESCPLTVTFRCPRSHVVLAQRLVPQIQAADDAIDGTASWIDPEDVTQRVEPGDLVICRKNAPAVGLAFRLIAERVPCRMLGRDIGTGLVALIDRLRPADPADLKRKIETWREKEINRAECRNQSDSVIQSINDRANCVAYSLASVDSVSELRQQFFDLFSVQESGLPVVTLSSVHRAKGSEADRVFILEPDCMPMIGRATSDWQVEQEDNILYIAVTRAKRDLIFCGDLPKPFRGARLTESPFEITREFDAQITPLFQER